MVGRPRVASIRRDRGKGVAWVVSEAAQAAAEGDSVGRSPIGLLLRDLQVEAPRIGLRVTEEDLALDLRMQHPQESAYHSHVACITCGRQRM